jgi:hypothetical protein
LVPASSGARAPLAREGLRLVRVCPCVVFRLQKSASVAEAQRSAYPVATERVDGSQSRARPKGRAPGRKGVDNLHRGGKTARQAKARAGRSKGRCGAKVLFVWKASRAVLPHAPLHAVERGPVLAGLGHGTRRASDAGPGVGIATEMSEARPHTSREEDNASRDERQTGNCGPPKRIQTWREPGDSPGKKAWEPTRHGCSYEEVRRQKSVRRIVRASAARGAARQVGGTALAQKRFARRADARSGGQPRGENGVRSSVTSRQETKRRSARWGNPVRA